MERAYVLLSDVPEEERPRERMLRLGPQHLSNAELIALLLRTGSTGESVVALAHRVLVKTDGLKGLAQTSLQELMKIHGIGLAKAVQLMAGVELGQRISRLSPEERYVIRSPEDVAQYVMDELRFAKQEHFVCLFLDTKHQVICKKCVFKGSLNASLVHPREIFLEAIRSSSAAVICIHNHPSGDPTPSTEDIHVTERLIEAGQLLGIEVLDHVIIGDQRFFSLREHGLIS
ncbi:MULTISPECIES: DNA repair protein RadC [unclassified Thermoactinomyces]|uniref:RadC family protein n=1 Tax=unclassified Thermoactinomyces TaxID=2634588 RepID=UPI0018DD7CBF|nr:MULTISPECIES: DNA repair protein RadC [unclassified Thermoactinomyces]MBH8596864.1 DNA repair protein RadC [Thermoactinomyces sp. CICC 10523]MBH8603624.1 DNA repair protein RadC [Thermoactinomyces sp. CICC 10522]MBH8606789.1 DNA repair protein RadC [Thermoactinomyces sp. CICC 10521]